MGAVAVDLDAVFVLENDSDSVHVYSTGSRFLYSFTTTASLHTLDAHILAFAWSPT
jgi:hypothetical protein